MPSLLSAAMIEAAEDEPYGVQQGKSEVGVENGEEDGSPDLAHAKKTLRPKFGEVL